jgi:predicted nucleic acid-binding protein
LSCLLDTQVLSGPWPREPDAHVVRRVDLRPPSALILSVLTFGELSTGVVALPIRARKQALDGWLTVVLPADCGDRVLPIDVRESERWVRLAAQPGAPCRPSTDCWTSRPAPAEGPGGERVFTRLRAAGELELGVGGGCRFSGPDAPALRSNVVPMPGVTVSLTADGGAGKESDTGSWHTTCGLADDLSHGLAADRLIPLLAGAQVAGRDESERRAHPWVARGRVRPTEVRDRVRCSRRP